MFEVMVYYEDGTADVFDIVTLADFKHKYEEGIIKISTKNDEFFMLPMRFIRKIKIYKVC